MTTQVTAQQAIKATGKKRHETIHYGVLDSATGEFTILHSKACWREHKHDLTQCDFSIALDEFWVSDVPQDESFELELRDGKIAKKRAPGEPTHFVEVHADNRAWTITSWDLWEIESFSSTFVQLVDGEYPLAYREESCSVEEMHRELLNDWNLALADGPWDSLKCTYEEHGDCSYQRYTASEVQS